MPSSTDTFEFGANWATFLSVVNEERIRMAVDSVQQITGLQRLDGRRFLDIGSGSGLFSLAARRLGAEVFSFDVDKDSVECTREIKRRYAPDDPHWRIEYGSALDPKFMSSLGTFDIVYSWGVLHHTGSMWQAIENAVGRVAEGGILCLALYNYQPKGTPRWTAIKRLYLRLPRWLRPLYTALVIAPLEIPSMVRHPVRQYKYIRHYAEQTQRGMSYWRDLVDWVGGYPFEAATPQQVVDFCRPRGFLLYFLTTAGAGFGCNQFGFIRAGSGAARPPERVNAAAASTSSV